MNKNQVQNFLTPHNISYVILFHEYDLNIQNLRGEDQFKTYLTQKVMNLDSEEPSANYSVFAKNIEKETIQYENASQIIQGYKERIENINELNELFKYLSETLKNLRNRRTLKLESGNIIDVFFRRCYLNFQKQGFSEMVKLFNDFKNYKNSDFVPQKPQLNQFQMDQDILNIQNRIENFSNLFDYDTISKQIKSMEEIKKNDKFYLLKAKHQAQNKRPLQAFNNMHKYFDKQLTSFFIPDQNMNINKVNHILINKASLNFEMGFYDEALRCLTEGLRIAQNNSDDESINYCLTYFYQISSILGKPQDALAIVEHALVHAVKLKNPQLQLISCLNYMNFRSMYVVEENGIQNSALTKKNVIWYETLQQSIRKLIQMYEYNLGNKMVNKEAFLDIPVTLYSLNLANQFLNLQQPQLSMMEYNSRKTLYQSTFQSQKAQIYLMEFALKTLEYNPQFALNQIEEVAKNNKILGPKFYFYLYAINFELFLKRNDIQSCKFMIHEMKNNLTYINDSFLFQKFLKIEIKLQIELENYDQAFNLVCKAIQFCKDKGYVNQELTEFQMYKAIIKFRCQDFLEALQDFCEMKIEAKKKQLMELKIQAKIYCALISSQLGNLTKSVNLLRKIENSFLANLSIEIQAFFYKSKAISMIPLALTFQGQDDVRKNMIKEILVQLQKSLEIYINLNSLNDIREIYYLQARIYDELQMEEHRETSSYFFLVAEELINNFDKEEYQYISLYGVKDLSLIDIQRDFLQTFPSHFKIFEI